MLIYQAGLISCYPMTQSKWVRLHLFSNRLIPSLGQQGVGDSVLPFARNLTTYDPMTDRKWVELYFMFKAVDQISSHYQQRVSHPFIRMLKSNVLSYVWQDVGASVAWQPHLIPPQIGSEWCCTSSFGLWSITLYDCQRVCYVCYWTRLPHLRPFHGKQQVSALLLQLPEWSSHCMYGLQNVSGITMLTHLILPFLVNSL